MDNIVIDNKENLKRTKSLILQDSAKQLQVRSDFDRTLTYAHVDGEARPSIISVLRDGNYLTDDYAQKAHALYSKYHQIEKDPYISLNKKKKAMLEWWKKHFDLLINSGLNFEKDHWNLLIF